MEATRLAQLGFRLPDPAPQLVGTRRGRGVVVLTGRQDRWIGESTDPLVQLSDAGPQRAVFTMSSSDQRQGSVTNGRRTSERESRDGASTDQSRYSYDGAGHSGMASQFACRIDWRTADDQISHPGPGNWSSPSKVHSSLSDEADWLPP